MADTGEFLTDMHALPCVFYQVAACKGARGLV